MNWFIAKIVFKISTEGNASMHQFDEHLRLIRALTFEEALLKARRLGLQDEDYFYNNKKQLVSWEFVNVADLRCLNDLADGVELYSQIEERKDGGEYIHDVHQRAALLHVSTEMAMNA